MLCLFFLSNVIVAFWIFLDIFWFVVHPFALVVIELL